MNVQCHTLAFGQHEYFKICLPTILDWTTRNNYSLKIWSKKDVEFYISPKFICKKILQDFLTSKDDFCLWIDADIYIQRNAPNLISEIGEGFWLAYDLGWGKNGKSEFELGCGWRDHWLEWCELNNFKKYENWNYRNFGVWAIDKKTAKKLLEIMVEPFLSPSRLIQDQHHMNFFAAQIQEDVKVLDYKWNAMVPRFYETKNIYTKKFLPNKFSLKGWQGGHFIHLISEKYKKIQEIEKLGGFDKFSIK